MSPIAPTLESLLGAAAVCSWDSLSSSFQSQIAQALDPEAAIEAVVYPETIEQLAEVFACAYQNQWRTLICGSGSKLHWGGLAKEVKLIVSTARLNQLIEHAIGDLTVTAEAGIRLSDLQALLNAKGQFLAIDPAYAETATLGGIVATADSGSLRQRYNGVRDMLLGISFVRSDGKLAKAGGRVVKNVAGYDLMKLFTGSWGTLGCLSQITFRIYPLPAASQTVILTGEASSIAKATAALLASGLSPVAIDLVDAQTVTALNLGKGLGLMTRFQNLEVAVEQQTEQLQAICHALGLQAEVRSGADEAVLWQQLRERIESDPNQPSITCKIGVLPSKAVEMLLQLEKQSSALSVARIHAGSGLGTLRFNSEGFTPEALLQVRSLCQSHQGFLTIQAAPLSFKQTLDVWGYPGNALDLMKRIKQQFDPETLLSPGRFVSGI
ncbi:MAG TPA: FAD-binding oxidoreductase [Trichocoleus sp.]|jgi:glycolate oxidase FAD binding subunit